eukprot:CAMPEP_0196995446 /NCGR_PEP_ID=MMETSP1380-20130617/1557_1 /TAXON_ID=5936 /ORGANISM="Euplotes crassus, Strain CT5" /LENGTH=143 /DNA_ID=CAMNT_0042411113 /DNA_START=20 /DNA_END=452 /DNA_ORIENTATION=+
MKYSCIVVIALLIGTVFSAAGDPHLRRGQELIDWIEGDMEGTIIVMFYDQHAPESRTKAMREEIEREILRPNPGFHYYEVNAIIDDYKDVREMCELNMKELKHSPTVWFQVMEMDIGLMDKEQFKKLNINSLTIPSISEDSLD